MLTTEDQIEIIKHPVLSGEQVFYHFGNGNGLSCINSKERHNYPFAWEIAVIENMKIENNHVISFDLNFDSSLTDDIEIFLTIEEANKFIKKSKEYFSNR